MSKQESIVNLEYYSHHVSIFTNDGDAYVVPESLIRDWVLGKKEPHPECVKRIIEEWINNLRDLHGDPPILDA